ncbi:hypothetical protein QCA50_016050 [Cerrena zonata]|uniref:Anaphase-promoting complex subunit 4 WD40 domain-containing protein n=1 Tax=Cerrena zonata TaxID=2478898 RepID=A0AAW0FTX3_9APHY
MTLMYRPKWTFTDNLYCQSIGGLAFSPDGLYLAYSSGGQLCVLEVDRRELMVVIQGRNTGKQLSTVTALAWMPQESFHIVCTFQDGVIASITRSSDQFHLAGIDSMIRSITHIALNPTGSWLAAGGAFGISIWTTDPNKSWSFVRQLGLPQRFQANANATVEITGIHWFEPKEDQLIVSYKCHGVQIWDVSSGKVIASILTTSTSIGSSSLSPDCKTLAVAMQSGYDIHHLESRVPLVSIPHELNVPGPILFVHGGLSLLGTTKEGEICLWGSVDGEKLQTLKQSASDSWRCFAAHDKTRFLIATAVKRKIVLWEATEEGDTINSAQTDRNGQLKEHWLLMCLLSVTIALLVNVLIAMLGPRA